MEQADLAPALQPHATKLKKKKQQTKKPQDIIDMVCRKRDTHSGSNLTRGTRITRETNRTLKLEGKTKCYLNVSNKAR